MPVAMAKSQLADERMGLPRPNQFGQSVCIFGNEANRHANSDAAFSPLRRNRRRG